jgi:hypothetical protein
MGRLSGYGSQVWASRQREIEMESDEKECPFCAEVIKAKAVVCKHCGRDLILSPTQTSTPPTPPQPQRSLMTPPVERGFEKPKQNSSWLSPILTVCTIVLIYILYKDVTGKERIQREAAANQRAQQEEQQRAERKKTQAARDMELPPQADKKPDEEQSKTKKAADRALQEAEAKEARDQAVAWAKSVIAQMRKDRVIKKEDKSVNTIWIDPIPWSTINRDLKQSMMQGVGLYFMDLEGSTIPQAKIRSFSDDSILCEMTDLEKVIIHR